MDIPTALAGQLLATPGVTNLIAQRVYPSYDKANDKTYPLAVYKVEGVSTLQTSEGPTGNQSGDFVVAAIGETYADAAAVAKAILAALDGQGGTWSGLIVQGVFLKEDGISDDVVTEPQTEEILYYVKEMTFEVKC